MVPLPPFISIEDNYNLPMSNPGIEFPTKTHLPKPPSARNGIPQNQENDWENGPSDRCAIAVPDGRQRASDGEKHRSLYYDAVRSRHSLSQPVNKSPESMKQEKSLHVQQVKYNSLPRPLPQRYPPVASNGQPVRTAWAEDHYDPNRSNGSMHRPTTNDPCGGMRQQYDSPPKPANRVPCNCRCIKRRAVH
ncbi:uncharacterized protein TNIN_317651 [Trichonephila inaurata madagascariensis]|uniref:Uncharacterized protein n=1 Tax=Trichonephila inaurata madagascariensis TaxID=2747483 RepID=A0A8X7BTM5_9ARAC|nr:uncharacterized protein TNIN_317651 [Trichonephila inaurata madagascariensis]